MNHYAVAGEHNEKILNNLLRMLSSVSAKTVSESAKLLTYGIALAVIYHVFGGNLESLALISPALVRLVQAVGGDVLGNIIEHVAENDRLPTDEILPQLEEALAKNKLSEVLSERDFWRAFSFRQRQDDQRYNGIAQKLDEVLAMLRQTQAFEDAPLKQLWGQGMDALRDSKIEYRRERVRRWREAIESFDFRNESFGGTVWYSELRPHLREGVVRKIEAPRTYIVPAEKRGEFAEKHILLDEIARIEGEWDLI